jgi:transposase InsO family protein
MKENNLLIKQKRHPNGITKADRDAQKSENIIKQDFSAQNPNEKWLSDITEVHCADGKLYVSAVLDCFDGAIVGLSFDNNMRKELCIASFEQACNRYKARGMTFHSDRGSQYTSRLFRDSLYRSGAVQSMSGTGRCYDNARMESFFATLKKEKLYKIKTEVLPLETVKTIIFRYVEIYYNRNRIYTTNTGGYPPLVYRNMYYCSMPKTA